LSSAPGTANAEEEEKGDQDQADPEAARRLLCLRRLGQHKVDTRVELSLRVVVVRGG